MTAEIPEIPEHARWAFDGVARVFKRAARDGEELAPVVLLKNSERASLTAVAVGPLLRNAFTKATLLGPAVRTAVKKDRATSLAFVAEAWAIEAARDDARLAGRALEDITCIPSEQPDRFEIVMLQVETIDHPTVCAQARIEGTGQQRRLGPWIIAENGVDGARVDTRWGDFLVDVEPATQKGGVA